MKVEILGREHRCSTLRELIVDINKYLKRLDDAESLPYKYWDAKIEVHHDTEYGYNYKVTSETSN